MKLRLLAAAAVVAACSHSRPWPEPQPLAIPSPPPIAQTPEPAPTPVAQPVETPLAQPAPVTQAPPPPTVVSIYFAFDKSDLTRESRMALSRAYIDAPEGARIRIEGNCDERGSREYNLALGQRRADAAKKYLVGLGADAASIETLSFGEERPKALGHDSESWRENRRDDVFVEPRILVGGR